MIECLNAETGWNRMIGNHEIQLVHGELTEQFFQRPLNADDPGWLVQLQRGAQNAMRDELRNRADHADTK